MKFSDIPAPLSSAVMSLGILVGLHLALSCGEVLEKLQTDPNLEWFCEDPEGQVQVKVYFQNDQRELKVYQIGDEGELGMIVAEPVTRQISKSFYVFWGAQSDLQISETPRSNGIYSGNLNLGSFNVQSDVECELKMSSLTYYKN